jgi:hypothetical protein
MSGRHAVQEGFCHGVFVRECQAGAGRTPRPGSEGAVVIMLVGAEDLEMILHLLFEVAGGESY